MAKTLLEIVQSILTGVSGDQVNSISDTEESEQIAEFVRGAYQDLMSHTKWPHTRRATALVSFSNSLFPTHVKLAEDVKELISVHYDVRKIGETKRNYRKLSYLDPDDFLRKLNSRDSDETGVTIVTDTSGIELLIRNNKAPEFYTSINDVDIVFDSYDSAVDTTLIDDKFQAQAYILPAFTLSNSFIPDLPPDAFSLLEQEALSRVQFRMRQIQDVKAEQEVQKQSRWLSRNAWRTQGGITFPNYGRKK